MERSADWFRQTERDLAHARRFAEAGDHEWTCFAAHQAAEKALKVHQTLDQIFRIVPTSDDLTGDAAYLDRFLAGPVPVDVFPFTEQEIAQRRAAGDRFVARVEDEGIDLLQGP